LLLSELADGVASATERTWAAALKKQRRGRTIILKLKTSEFQSITRSITPPARPNSEQELFAVAMDLLNRVELPDTTRYRLVGIGLSHFLENEPQNLQPGLFSDTNASPPNTDGQDGDAAV